MAGKLLLLPNLLGDHKHHEIFLPSSVDKAVQEIDGLIAESYAGGDRYLKRFKKTVPIELLNEHTKEIESLLEPLIKGETWGLVSDAGLPVLADPGALLVERARLHGVKIQAFVGPSSITLALMLSGFPAQQFSFLGYPPRKPDERILWIKKIEKEAATQLFIEAPYRNMALLQALLSTLNDATKLCVAWDLTLPTAGIVSQAVSLWKKSPLPNIDDKPAIFLIKTK